MSASPPARILATWTKLLADPPHAPPMHWTLLARLPITCTGPPPHDFLLVKIVRQHFGEQAEEICDALMKRPKRTLKELQTDCQAIPLGQLRNGLLILIHHNLVGQPLSSA